MVSFTVESWTWYAVTITMVLLRFVARTLHFKSIFRLQPEDWLMLLLTCLYTILITFLNIDTLVNTNLIDPKDIPSLTPTDIAQRTWGSKTILLVEQCMCAVQWGTKVCLLLLYWRLTQSLRQNIVVKIAFVYVGLTYIVMEVLYFGYWCRPFQDYWLTPTPNVQCSTALHHLIMNLAFNLSTDILIMSIPIPLVMKTHLEMKRKILLAFPFCLGAFTIVCAILSKHLSFTQPFSGYWVYWYCRESSTAMIVTNMPYTWSLFRRIFKLSSFFEDSTRTADRTTNGMSTRGISVADGVTVTSTSRIRNGASKLFAGRKETAEGKSMAMNTMRGKDLHQWRDSPNSMDIKSVAGTTAEPSSSGNSVVRAPFQASDTTNALDKLYPLDDDDDEAELVPNSKENSPV